MKKAILSVVVGLAGVAAWGGVACAPLWSQTHKVTGPETVVRAVGVYEWTGDLARPTGSRFVPVTVFIDGELQDGGIYLPRPIPFALLTGNVYELEDAGLGKGTIVLETAMKATTPDEAPAKSFIEGWTAYGSYKAPPAERKSAPLRASKNLPVITTSGGDPNKPHLSNKSDTAKTDTTKSGDANKTADSQSSTTPASTGDTASAQQKNDDPDRPTMHRRTSSDDTTTSTGTASGNGDTSTAAAAHPSSDDDKAERPTLKRRSPEEASQDEKQKKKGDIATVTGPASLNDDPDRPTLKHGSKSTADTEMPKLMGVPPDMKQMVAISDAKNRPPHPFGRPWEDTAERAAILAKMQAFARTRLTEYGIVPGVTPPQPLPSTAVAGTKTASGSASTPAVNEGPGPPKLKRGIPTDATTTTAATKTAPASTAAKKAGTTTTAGAKGKQTTAKAPPPVELAGEDLKGYLLSYGGAPTYVYMAHTVETGSVMRYVTIVAQDDGMGQLKLALASVTDAAHLDRTPWMRLVDVVDVEASNRASLLFELRGSSSRQFALYRVIAAKPEQIFATSM